MNNQNVQNPVYGTPVPVKPEKSKKNKGISAVLILLSLMFFVISGVLLCFSFIDFKKPTVKPAEPSADDEMIVIEPSELFTALDDAVMATLYNTLDVKNNDIFNRKIKVFAETDAASLMARYAEYAESIGDNIVDAELFTGDFDRDGTDEAVVEIGFNVCDFVAQVESEEKAADFVNKEYFIGENIVLLLYADNYKDTVSVRTFTLYNETVIYDLHIEALNSVLRVTGGDDYNSFYHLAPSDAIYKNYAYREEAFRALCKSYIQYQSNADYYGIKYICADISDAEGEEIIFGCKNGDYYLAEIVTAMSGCVNYIYSNVYEECATFLIEIGSETYILEYHQDLGDSYNNYTANYSYNIYRFDENYERKLYENGATTVKYGVVSAENEEFFAKFNTYLDSVIVICDPYELTGYSELPYSTGMSTHEYSVDYGDDDVYEAEPYLYIANCPTTKMGVVNVPQNSYLNFREGPSKEYDRILLNITDEESFVRQLRGSSVTVIDTVNTYDEENPIWLKIQIKYNGQTLVGYSSQAYIDLPGIKRVAVGESFTLDADTNDSGIRWSVSDPYIAEIDYETGRFVGTDKGIVMVEVTSSSGLTDSCLIEIY